MHEQLYFPVHRDSHLSGYDVVFGVGIVGRIKTKEILVSLADQFRVEWAELAIPTGITKIEGKLPGLHLNGQGGRRRWSEIDAGPGLSSEYPQGQNFGSYQQESGDHQSHRAAGKGSNSGAGLRIRESPDEKGEKELRGQKRNACLCHRVRVLLVD